MSLGQPALPSVTASPPSRGFDDELLITQDTLQVLVAFRDRIAADRRLRGAQLKVLIYLLPELLDRRHRVVKQVVLARALRMNQGLVSDCLRLLVKHGLVERGPNDGSLSTYRLSATMLSCFRYRKEKSATP